MSADARPVRRHRLWPWALGVVLVVALLATWAVHREAARQRQLATERLQSVATLRESQVENWIARHMALARFLRASVLWAGLFDRWQGSGDLDARDVLLGRVVDFRKASDGDSALLFSPGGDLLAQEGSAPPRVPDELRAAVQQAAANGEAVHTNIYHADNDLPPVRMDVVIPVRGNGSTTRGVVVMRIDAARAGPFAVRTAA